MITYFMKKASSPMEQMVEYIFADMDYMDNVLTLENKFTGEEVSGTVTFGYGGMTLTTRGYVEYDVIAIIPEEEL